MMAAWVLFLALQEPVKTVEDRLKELEAKLSGLEDRSQKLSEENAQLEKRLADAKAIHENHAKQVASAWVKRYAKEAEFSEKQAQELEALWIEWTKEDLQKPADEARWKSREEALRTKITAEQAGRVERKVREEQEQLARMMVASFLKSAKVAPERSEAAEKIVFGKLKLVENAVLYQAHPGKRVDWVRLVAAVDGSLPELSGVLAAEEHGAVQKTVERWKTMSAPRK